MTKIKEDFIERRIITGLIISKDYLERVQRFWDPMLLDTPEFRKIAGWCIEHYQQYHTAPDMDIESIYMTHLKEGHISKSEAQYIEKVLNDLSDDYGRDTHFNAAYLYDQTVQYLKGQELAHHNEEVQMLMDAGRVEDAEALIHAYHSSILQDVSIGLDLSSEEALDRIDKAFNISVQQVLSYPGAIGTMWNEQLIRGGFIAFLAPEKRGKTFMLMDLALRGIRQKSNVAFFQAGDMTEAQQLKRIAVYLAKRSNQERYCGTHFRPIGDCIYNQLDLCTRSDRNCDHGIFDTTLEVYLHSRQTYMNLEVLQEKYKEFPKYKPCDSLACDKRMGCVWITKVPKKEPLTGATAQQVVSKFFVRYKRRFKLVTYPADSLSVDEIHRVLDTWEQEDGFVPDIVCVDYADLLAPDTSIKEFRHQVNAVWKSLRGLSQEKHILLVTATQADADSYKQGRLNKSNFSEDKRKLAHVTAMYGLNQDAHDREKKLGNMRINEIVVREGEFSNSNEVYLLQDLYAGRPYLESFK